MLSEVPEGWDKARIDAVLQRDTTSVSVTELAAEGVVAHYSLPAFDANKKPVIESGSEIKSNKTAIDKDCLLFSKLNPRIPRVWRVRHFGEQKPVCSTEFWALKPKKGEVSLSYAEYFLGWNGFLSHPTIKPASSTNSHQRVDRKAFDAFILPLPPLNEQHRIAEILSSVDASIQATQAVIEQAERVKRGLMEELLTGGLGSEAIEHGEVPEGWHKAELGSLFVVKSSKRVLQKQWRKEGIPFYRGREITALSEEGFVNNELFIEQELYEEFSSKHGVPKAGDILITAIGTIGNTYLVREDDRFYFKDASVLWLESASDNLSAFVDYWLKSNLFFNQLDVGNGTTVDSLTISKMKSLSMVLPSVDEQKRLAAILSDVDVLISKQKEIVKQQNRTKRGLMDDLLTGKVRAV